MMAEEIPAADALSRALARGRARSARRFTLLRRSGLFAFLELFILLGSLT